MKKLFCKMRDKWKSTVAREKTKMENMTFREKAEYLLANWTWEFIATVAVIGMIIGGVYMFDNATSRYILSVAVVDATATGKEAEAICQDIKDYLGNTNRKEKVELVTNATTFGATHEEATSNDLYENQQNNFVLIQSGTVDVFVATKKFADFLLEMETSIPVEEALSEEQMEKYGDLIDLDGMALRLDSAAAREYLTAGYEPAYLIFSSANHYPDITRSFVDFIMSK